jgi:hypothetical protein
MNDEIPFNQNPATSYSWINVFVGVSLVVGTCLLIAMLQPAFFGSGRERAGRMNCMSNLKQIGLAITMYANEHDEKIPGKFDDLRPYSVALDKLLICPSAEDTRRPSYQILLGGKTGIIPSR